MTNYPDPVTVNDISRAADGDDTEEWIEAELAKADEEEDAERFDGGPL